MAAMCSMCGMCKYKRGCRAMRVCSHMQTRACGLENGPLGDMERRLSAILGYVTVVSAIRVSQPS